jgi:AcrR family transcriptional regulator
MTTASSATPAGDDLTPTAVRLVFTAERLFARDGIEGVSLRRIAAEAGSANNSAVHYHFGSKEGLIAAIFRYRLPQLISERRLLAAGSDPTDLRSRFEAHYLPLLHLADAPDSHYITFVEQLSRSTMATTRRRAGGTTLPALPKEGQRSHDAFRRDLDHLLADLDEPLRRLRIATTEVLCLHAAADRERLVAQRAARTPFELFASSLFDGLVGFLVATPSATTRHWLTEAGAFREPTLRLL